MRVALFFDGKNHMKDLGRAVGDRWIDHGALAEFVVAHVGGTRFQAAHYYTGIPVAQEDGSDKHALADLLRELERRPGFFVHRFNRRTTSRECPHCEEMIAFTEEKMVDTSLVADVILLAVQDAYDVAVVFSGDLDVAPALTAVHAMGKQVWIATFGDAGLARSLSRAAWSTIDLKRHLEEFAHAVLGSSDTPNADPQATDGDVLRELRRAEAHFSMGGASSEPTTSCTGGRARACRRGPRAGAWRASG